MLRRVLHVALFVLASALGAVALAAYAVRSPAAWPVVPHAAFRLADALVKPETQEDVADAEFLACWLCGFVALGLGGGAVGLKIRRRDRR